MSYDDENVIYEYDAPGNEHGEGCFDVLRNPACFRSFDGWKYAGTNLPTDPVDLAGLVAAILNAADCRLERLVFPEDALKGMHGMTVVKR